MKQLTLAHYGIVLGICLMLFGTTAQGQSDPEKVRLIEQEAVGWSRNMDQLMAVFTDDVIYEDAPMGLVLHGKQELRGFATTFFNGFPSAKMSMVFPYDLLIFFPSIPGTFGARSRRAAGSGKTRP